MLSWFANLCECVAVTPLFRVSPANGSGVICPRQNRGSVPSELQTHSVTPRRFWISSSKPSAVILEVVVQLAPVVSQGDDIGGEQSEGIQNGSPHMVECWWPAPRYSMSAHCTSAEAVSQFIIEVHRIVVWTSFLCSVDSVICPHSNNSDDRTIQ